MIDKLILKISGHLIKYPNALSELVNTILNAQKSNDILIVLIPGGSVFSDLVNELQARLKFNDDIAHWMAIKAMEVYGSYISNMFSSIIMEVYDLSTINSFNDLTKIPLLMPYRLIKNMDELPHSWDVTSDSIAIYLAHKLGLHKAIMAKLVDGIVRNGKMLRRVNVDEVLNTNVIDNYSKTLIKTLSIKVIIFNALKPWLLNKIINEVDDEYTIILP